MMEEFKDLKQTVVTLIDNSVEGELDEESDVETSHQSHDKDAAKVKHRVIVEMCSKCALRSCPGAGHHQENRCRCR